MSYVALITRKQGPLGQEKGLPSSYSVLEKKSIMLKIKEMWLMMAEDVSSHCTSDLQSV